MRKKIVAAVLTAGITFASLAPAFADGAASTRNILIGGAAAAILVTNYNHKKRQRQAELREQARRQEAFRSWFYSKYGYYPTNQQFREWYYRTYGVNPK